MKIIKLICDLCGCEGHESTEPDNLCIEALRREIKDLEKNHPINLYDYKRRETAPYIPKMGDMRAQQSGEGGCCASESRC